MKHSTHSPVSGCWAIFLSIKQPDFWQSSVPYTFEVGKFWTLLLMLAGLFLILKLVRLLDIPSLVLFMQGGQLSLFGIGAIGRPFINSE